MNHEQKIKNRLEDTINQILNIKYNYDLNEYFNEVKDDLSIYENIINQILPKINCKTVKTTYNESEKINQVLEFFDKEDEIFELSIVDNQAEKIVNNLINKKQKNIKITELIDYSIDYEIKKNEINNVLKRIVLRLIIINIYYA